MKYLLIHLSSLIAFSSYSQEFKGQIHDSNNENPISYVNVGIIGRNIGTVSDINGRFNLKSHAGIEYDTIRISCIGYHSKNLLIKDILDNNLNLDSVKITLIPETYKIGEVQIAGDKPKQVTLGNPIKDNDNQKIRTDSLLGSEIGLVIRIPRKNKKYKLKDFTFNLADHDFEAEIRINIYNLVGSKPKENILREPIYYSIPSDKEILMVDLADYDIIINDDFFISIENFKGIPSMDKRLKFYGVSGLGDSRCFYRMVSQGGWNKIKFAGVQFKLTAYEY